PSGDAELLGDAKHERAVAHALHGPVDADANAPEVARRGLRRLGAHGAAAGASGSSVNVAFRASRLRTAHQLDELAQHVVAARVRFLDARDGRRAADEDVVGELVE